MRWGDRNDGPLRLGADCTLANVLRRERSFSSLQKFWAGLLIYTPQLQQPFTPVAFWENSNHLLRRSQARDPVRPDVLNAEFRTSFPLRRKGLRWEPLDTWLLGVGCLSHSWGGEEPQQRGVEGKAGVGEPELLSAPLPSSAYSLTMKAAASGLSWPGLWASTSCQTLAQGRFEGISLIWVAGHAF